METDEKKNLIPPYFSWKTFSSYIKSLNQALPPIIDKSAMRNLNGSNQNIMMNALKYLKLIRADGAPEKLLVDLVDASTLEKQSAYQELLRAMLQGAYPFLFDGSDSFNLEKSTSNQFDGKFKAAGASGDTVQKCEAFFIAAAQTAGLKLSPHILDAKKRGPRKMLPQKPKMQKIDKAQDGGSGGGTPPPPGPNGTGVIPPAVILPKWYQKFEPLFAILPDAEKTPRWTKAKRNNWIAAFTAMLDAFIEVDDGGNE